MIHKSLISVRVARMDSMPFRYNMPAKKWRRFQTACSMTTKKVTSVRCVNKDTIFKITFALKLKF